MQAFNRKARIDKNQKIDLSLHSAKVPTVTPNELVGTTMLAPVWKTLSKERVSDHLSSSEAVLIVSHSQEAMTDIEPYYPHASHLIISKEESVERLSQQLKTRAAIDHIVWISPQNAITAITDDTIITHQETGVLNCFRMIKALLDNRYDSKHLKWTILTFQTQQVYSYHPIQSTHASILGLMGSMAKEYSNWQVRVCDLETNGHIPHDIFTLPVNPNGDPYVYRNGKWYAPGLIPCHIDYLPQSIYRKQGVYVIIGGAGGIGKEFSRYLIETYDARIIWMGRKQEDDIIRSKISELSISGTAPVYISADATDFHSLTRAYEQIKARFSNIHGIIHSAIVLKDKGLANMDETRFKETLCAKVNVSVRMAQVFQHEKLDFVLFFSSMMSFVKAPGQSNYAAGCTFKDAFAISLSMSWNCPVKVINWGYWGSVGIVASEVYQKRMEKEGIGSITTMCFMQHPI